MPEGDSVYRLAERLRPTAGSTVIEGEIRSGAAAGASLGGSRIVRFETHGKHLLTYFSTDEVLHTHMLMQGSWTVTGAGRRLPKRLDHLVRVRLLLDDARTIWAVDMPVVDLVRQSAVASLIGHLGPDPLRADWDAAEAARRIALRPDRELVTALGDQRSIAGLGNLWVNELAFLAGRHPRSRVGDMDIDALVARAARALRASAIIPGMYQVTTGVRRRGERHWVVGRAGRPCLRCGTAVLVTPEVPGDVEHRRTWWCPRCQPDQNA